MVYRRRPAARRPRRRPARRYRKKSAPRLHAPKKFVATFKYQDVIAQRNGTNAGGWQRNLLYVDWSMLPISSELSALYRQFAITGVSFEYRPTNTVPNEVGSNDNYVTQMMFLRDKDSDIAINVSQATSQDDVINTTTNRKFTKYVAKPRPLLYQLDSAGNTIKITTPAKQTEWLSTRLGNNAGLKHLAAQMLVQDSPGAVTDTKQGELWCKMYVVVKEQCL